MYSNGNSVTGIGSTNNSMAMASAEPLLRATVAEIAEMLIEANRQLDEADSKLYKSKPQNVPSEGQNLESGDNSLETGIARIRYIARSVRDQAIEVNSRI